MTEPAELLEKGARALWDSESPMVPWEQAPFRLQAEYRAQVKAVLDAMFPGGVGSTGE